MTPQEKDLIISLLNRLKQAGSGPKDREAEALIRQAVTEQPDAPYQLVQTVLIQDMALNQAQSRIADLEKQLAEATARTQPTSFLGGLAGRTGGAGTAQPGPWGQSSQLPPFGPWGQQAPPPSAGYGQGGYTRPDYSQQPAPTGFASGVSGGSGFLRSAATTAAGVAGGALLFEGIRSMFGHHDAESILGGVAPQPAITETVINNYYGDDPDGPHDYGAQDVGNGPDYVADDSFDNGGDIGGGDIGDDDIGGDVGGFDDGEVI